jgi:hypothetical protein
LPFFDWTLTFTSGLTCAAVPAFVEAFVATDCVEIPFLKSDAFFR